MTSIVPWFLIALVLGCGSTAPTLRGSVGEASGGDRSHGAFAVVESVVASPEWSQTSDDLVGTADLIVTTLESHEAQLVACYEPALAEHPQLVGRAEIAFSIAAGAVTDPSVRFTDATVAACVRHVLDGLRFPNTESSITATGIIHYSPGPPGCERIWRVGPRARACQRAGGIDLVESTDALRVTHRVPGTMVYDATGESVFVAGSCFADIPGDAVCVISGAHGPSETASVGLVYLDSRTASRPGFQRGVVGVDAGSVLVTNGRAAAWDNATNKSSGEVEDVQAQLAADGLRPASCPEWRVITPLHRDRSRFVMTFEECGGQATTVALEIGKDEELHWRRMP